MGRLGTMVEVGGYILSGVTSVLKLIVVMDAQLCK